MLGGHLDAVDVHRHAGHASRSRLFHLMSRGMTEDEAAATIVRGFVE